MVGCFVIEQIGIACERAQKPEMRDAPLALTGPNQTVLTVSDEAAQAGVRVGHALSAATLLCPGLVHKPYDRAAYLQAAERAWDALAVETSFVEPAGPEVCFAELTGREHEPRLRQLARTIGVALGAQVRASLASARFVAECVARNAPGASVVVVNPGDEAWTLAHCRLSGVADLDPRSVERLGKLGIHTIGEVFDIGSSRLPKALQPLALTLIRRSQGLDSPPVRALWPPRTESARIAFEDEVADLVRIEEALRRGASDIASRLSGGFTCARQVALSVCFPDGTCQVETEETAFPVTQADTLFRTAQRLWNRMGIGRSVTEILIEARRIAAPRSVQLSLLDGGSASEYLPHEREQRRAAALRFLKRRFGTDAVIPLQALHESRRISLWTHALGHVIDEPVTVTTGADGAPERVGRRGASPCRVTLQDNWTEADYSCGALTESDVFRVTTDRGAMWELHRHGADWRLMSLAD